MINKLQYQMKLFNVAKEKFVLFNKHSLINVERDWRSFRKNNEMRAQTRMKKNGGDD